MVSACVMAVWAMVVIVFAITFCRRNGKGE